MDKKQKMKEFLMNQSVQLEDMRNQVKEKSPDISKEIEETFHEDNLSKILTGRKGIKTVRPKGDSNEIGLKYYIWRQTRFNCGIDPSLPIMAGFELGSWLNKRGIDKYSDIGKLIVNYVDSRTYFMNQINYGMLAHQGIARWNNALFRM